jgi:hypothetical protein
MAAAPRILPMPPLGAALLLLAAATSAFIFVVVVWPALTGAVKAQHAGHWGWVRLHSLTGAIMLITAPLNLYVGSTRRWFEWHRHIGCTYIGAGYTAALAALAVNWQNPHGTVSIAVSTSLLAIAWMVTASMGWRTGSQRKWRAHGDWMIRSYVLTFSFVLCRMTQRSAAGELLGPDGDAAVVWLTWLVPLALCELGLTLWRRRRAV